MNRLVERRQAYADGLIAVSDHIARDALKHFPDLGERLQVVPPGINFDRFSADGGQQVLIEAMKRLERSDVFCLLLGSSGTPPPFERELEDAIERAELHGRVQIGPYVEDMPAAYMLADVVVATGGANRGFSRTLVEAQAMGRPVVAEDGGGATETVRAGVTRWLAPPRDPPPPPPPPPPPFSPPPPPPPQP